MCGIAVAIAWHDAESYVRRLIAGLSHRGDITDPLITVGSDIALCTRRLRIVDPANGTQPKASFDGRFLVSLNGEIYNHAELRGELESAGIHFHSACDTEVVANALRLWGPCAIKRFRGMFAFVAVDVATGDFLAARDPFGIKPLYLVQSRGGFLFCSEMQPLLDVTEDEKILYLPAGYVLTPTFRGRYYQFQPRKTGGIASPEIASPKALDRLLDDAMQMRLPQHLPAAILFSGGIDSTLVAHYARRFSPAMPAYIAAGRDAPDYAYAARYADDTGLDLRVVPIDVGSSATLPLIEAVIGSVEAFEPAIIRPGLYTYAVSQRIHEDGFRVALCGEGADELFAGYEPLEEAFGVSDAAGRYVQSQCLGMMHRANLQRVDRCSMRFQLEIRELFLDPSIVAYASNLGRSRLLEGDGDGQVGKAPLRALYDLYPSALPDYIRDRRKMPFHEGAAADAEGVSWLELFEAAVSDAELRDGQREYAAFGVANKEELYFLRTLAAKMDVRRVPHFRARLRLHMPNAHMPDSRMPNAQMPNASPDYRLQVSA
jgi:asparagine synthase (glutamine-hydrolysing)